MRGKHVQKKLGMKAKGKEKESISSLACHPKHTGHGHGDLLRTKR